MFLCVKPYLLGKLLEEIKHVVTEKQLFVSVAAGVPLEFMEEVSSSFSVHTLFCLLI